MQQSVNWDNIECTRFDPKTNSIINLNSHAISIRQNETIKVIEISEYCENCKMSYWHIVEKNVN